MQREPRPQDRLGLKEERTKTGYGPKCLHTIKKEKCKYQESEAIQATQTCEVVQFLVGCEHSIESHTHFKLEPIPANMQKP